MKTLTLNDYFDEIYVINLKHRKDKLDSASAQFEKIGTSFKRFEAVDGYKENLKCAPYTGFDPNFWNAGAAGLLETTKLVLEDAMKNNYNKILICEDDVEFDDDFNSNLRFLKEVPPEWHLVLFGAQNLIEPEYVTDHIGRLKYFFCLHCYAVNKNIFEYYHALLSKRDSEGRYLKQLDFVTAEDLRPLNECYCFTPNVAFQKSFYSDIQRRTVNHNSFLKSTKVIW